MKQVSLCMKLIVRCIVIFGVHGFLVFISMVYWYQVYIMKIDAKSVYLPVADKDNLNIYKTGEIMIFVVDVLNFSYVWYMRSTASNPGNVFDIILI